MCGLGQTEKVLALNRQAGFTPNSGHGLAPRKLTVRANNRHLTTSLNDLIGAGEQRRRNSQTKRFASLQVDRQFKSSRQFEWKLARRRPFQDAIDLRSNTTPKLLMVSKICHQLTRFNVPTL